MSPRFANRPAAKVRLSANSRKRADPSVTINDLPARRSSQSSASSSSGTRSPATAAAGGCVERGGERGEAFEQPRLGLGQQVVAPHDGRLQRVVVRARRPAGGCGAVREASLWSMQGAGGGEGVAAGRAGGGRLDRRGSASSGRAGGGDEPAVSSSSRPMSGPKRRGLARGTAPAWLVIAMGRQRGQGQQLLARHAERFTAGGQHGDLRRGVDRSVHQLRHAAERMLSAGVDDQQLAHPKRVEHAALQRLAVTPAQLERIGEHGEHLGVGCHGHQVDEQRWAVAGRRRPPTPTSSCPHLPAGGGVTSR